MFYEDEKEALMAYRKRLEKQLHEWMPGHDRLIREEMKIFDHQMSRRDFIKHTSVFVAAALLGQGCGHDNGPVSPPSDGNIPFDTTTVKKASKIVVDSDIVDGVQTYASLAAFGSTDAPHIIDDSLLESFNPHLSTVTSANAFETAGFATPNRSYGTAEIVQLCRDGEGQDYYLDFYEKSTEGQEGLEHKQIRLNGSSSYRFRRMVSANGNYHNRVANATVYSQKMVAASETEWLSGQSPVVYFQSGSNPLLMPGTKDQSNPEWQALDIIDAFKTAEPDVAFTTFRLLDLDSYKDGMNHSFIYGTIQFDDFYNYGFVVTYAKITDTAPTVTFFAPKFLSPKDGCITTLKNSYRDAFEKSGDTSLDGVTLKDFSLFAHQRFIPFAQLANSGGDPLEHVLFTFVCFNSANDGYVNGTADVNADGTIDLSHFTTVDSSIIKRYLVAVNTAQGGVQYLMQDYTLTPSVTIDPYTFTLDFDTGTLPSTDIWKELYDPEGEHYSQAELRLKESFIRSLDHTDSQTQLTFLTSYYDRSDTSGLGVRHYALTLRHTPELSLFTISDKHSSISKVDDARDADGKDYKALWFDTIVKNNYGYASLADAINRSNGVYDFYCTQNRNGMLRSYFVIDMGKNRFLVNFNEESAGQNGERVVPRTHETLYAEIRDEVFHAYPPLPVRYNIKKLHHWINIGAEEEIVFTALRNFVTDETKRIIEPNDGTHKLYSYQHGSIDFFEKSWLTKEYTKKIPDTASKKEYVYKATAHHVHLHINNIYGYPASLEENRYVEINFSKNVQVADMSDPDNPVTFTAGRFNSLFLKPDRNGKITLRVDSGVSIQDRISGTTMAYRIVDRDDLTPANDSPVATVNTSSSNTTAFKKCNISFRQMERLSTDKISKRQKDAPYSADNLEDVFQGALQSEHKEDFSKITDIYGKLYQKARPDNEAALISLSSATPGYSNMPAFAAATYSRSDSGKDMVNNTLTAAGDFLQDVSDDIEDAVNAVIRSITETLDAITREVNDFLAGAGRSLTTLLSKIMNFINLIIREGIDIWKKIWFLLKAMFDPEGAYRIGQELKQLFVEQLQPNPAKPDNAYSIIEKETETVKEHISDISQTVKTKIDGVIDDAMGRYSDDHKKDEKNYYKTMQENSTHLHFISDQTLQLFALFQLDIPTPNNESFECGSGATVEEMLGCLMTEEVKTAAGNITKLARDSESTFGDLILGKSDAVGEDAAKVMKDGVELIIDQIEVTAKGAVSLPLAFLNGSSVLNAAFTAVDGVMKEVYELLGQILFQDKIRFQTLDDLGFFALGEMLQIMISISDEMLEALGIRKDLRTYLQSGQLRTDIDTLSAKGGVRALQGDLDLLTEVTLICNIFDAWIQMLLTSFDFIKLLEGTPPFKTFARTMVLVRAVFQIPKFFVHPDNEEPVITFLRIGTSILFMASLILNFVKIGFSWVTEVSTRELLGAVYATINFFARIYGLILTILKTVKKGADQIPSLIKSVVLFLQAIIKFYTETTPEPAPQIATVNLSGSAVVVFCSFLQLAFV